VSDRRQSLLLWFGVAAPPLAWVVQLLAGWLVDEARCGNAGMQWGIDDHLWQALISAGAILVAVAGTFAAFTTHRVARRDARGRVAFLGITSLSAGLLFVLLTIVTTIGVLWMEPCVG